MVVQFSCPGCQQPIEVDGEFAGTQVGCPFCKRVVTAPENSTLTPQQTAAPVVARQVAPTQTLEYAGGSPGFNRLAVVGLACTAAALLLWILSNVLLAPLILHVDPKESFQVQQQQIIEYVEESDSMGQMLVGLGRFCFGSVCWLCGLVLSIIAVRRRHLRGYRVALVGVISSALLTLLMCSGTIIDSL